MNSKRSMKLGVPPITTTIMGSQHPLPKPSRQTLGINSTSSTITINSWIIHTFLVILRVMQASLVSLQVDLSIQISSANTRKTQLRVYKLEIRTSLTSPLLVSLTKQPHLDSQSRLRKWIQKSRLSPILASIWEENSPKKVENSKINNTSLSRSSNHSNRTLLLHMWQRRS